MSRTRSTAGSRTLASECKRFVRSANAYMRRREVIGDLKGMAKTHITTFMANNKGIPPAKIIMFRDGVSDGQWQIVKE